MIYLLKAVLTQDELTELRAIAARVRWDDGRKTAGPIAAPLKHNTEAPHDSREAQAAAEITLRAVRRHPQFFSAALPALMSPPMMNRYTEGMDYGDHCDAAIMGGGAPMRVDLHATRQALLDDKARQVARYAQVRAELDAARSAQDRQAAPR